MQQYGRGMGKIYGVIAISALNEVKGARTVPHKMIQRPIQISENAMTFQKSQCQVKNISLKKSHKCSTEIRQEDGTLAMQHKVNINQDQFRIVCINLASTWFLLESHDIIVCCYLKRSQRSVIFRHILNQVHNLQLW